MTVSATYQRVIREISPTLGAAGLRRKGAQFGAETTDAWRIVAFQRSMQYSTATSIRFTINLGVFLKQLATAEDRRAGRDFPPDTACQLRLRLGDLLDEPEDTWWIIDHETDPFQLSGVISQLLRDRALPYLAEIGNETRVRDLWLSSRSPGLTDIQRLRNLARLLDRIGPREKLSPVLAELVDKAPGIGRALAEDLGLAMPM